MALVCLCRGNFYWPPHTTILFCSIFLDKIVLDTLKSRYHRSAPLGIEFNLPEIFADILLNFGLPGWALPSMFLIFSACISLFANFAVIYPLLMPLIPVVAAATGMNSITLFCGMCLGSCLTGFSPFSTGGACQLSGCTDTDLARKLTPRMLLMAFFNAVLIAAILASGILNFLPDPLA